MNLFNYAKMQKLSNKIHKLKINIMKGSKYFLWNFLTLESIFENFSMEMQLIKVRIYLNG